MADGSPNPPVGAPLDRLRLVQWLSPAFPIGAFAYSQGLETAISEEKVTDPTGVEIWLRDILTRGTGRLEAVLLARARDEDADLTLLTDLAHAYAASAERHLEMTEQGRAFGQVIATLTGETPPPLPYALALGHATRALNLPTEEVLELWLMGLANQILQAAVRFLPMGQTEAQAMLARLLPTITVLAAEAVATPLGAISSTTPGADLAQMRHETLPTRIFRT